MKDTSWICPLKNHNKDSPCGGDMTPDGLCLNHSVLFDHWGCGGGYELYEIASRESARAAFKLLHKNLTKNQIKSLAGRGF